jgi:hypothetical protein
MSFERLTVEDHFDGSPAAYKNRCYTFLIILCNEKDLGAAFKYAYPCPTCEFKISSFLTIALQDISRMMLSSYTTIILPSLGPGISSRHGVVI